MTRILLASALALGISGAAVAKDAPVHVGNFSASVQSELDRDARQVNAAAERQGPVVEIDRTTTASIPSYTLRQYDDAYNK